MSATTMQQILVHETKEEHEYDRERVLRAYHLLSEAGLLAGIAGGGYGEHPNLDDDGRIISLFEILVGSQLGDELFGCLDQDSGSDLIERSLES